MVSGLQRPFNCATPIDPLNGDKLARCFAGGRKSSVEAANFSRDSLLQLDDSDCTKHFCQRQTQTYCWSSKSNDHSSLAFIQEGLYSAEHAWFLDLQKKPAPDSDSGGHFFAKDEQTLDPMPAWRPVHAELWAHITNLPSNLLKRGTATKKATAAERSTHDLFDSALFLRRTLSKAATNGDQRTTSNVNRIFLITGPLQPRDELGAGPAHWHFALRFKNFHSGMPVCCYRIFNFALEGEIWTKNLQGRREVGRGSCLGVWFAELEASGLPEVDSRCDINDSVVWTSLSDNDSVHGHWNLNKTKCSVIARYRNCNAQKLSKKIQYDC